jgi:hypothetical protein
MEAMFSHSGKKPEIPQKSLTFSLTPVKSPCLKEEEIRRVKIEFVADESVAPKIERAKQLLRHKYPQGKLEDIFNEALELLLEKKAPERKIARMEKAAGGKEERSAGRIQTRYIPQEIRREVWKRDGGQCAYRSPDGRRCEERGGLELEHLFPWSLGGGHDVQNFQILCRSHNQWRAFKSFGGSYRDRFSKRAHF